jgi:hypothetical protein
VTVDYTAAYLPIADHGAGLGALAEQGLTGSIRPVEDVMVLNAFPQALFGQFAQATGWAIFAARRALAVEFPIYYCFVKSDLSNAIAFNFEEWACIAVSDKLLLEIQHLVCELSHSDFLSMYRHDIPRVHFGSDHPADRVQLVRKAMSTRRMFGPGPKLIKTLTAIAVMFIVKHEFGHIANGHLGGDLVGAALGEVEASSTPDELITLRTLEYDADAMATQLTLEYCFRIVGNAGDSTEYFTDGASAIHTVFAAMYLVMCVLEAAQATTIPDWRNRSHPPAIFRYFATFSAAFNALMKMKKNPVSFKGRVGKGLSIGQQAIIDAQARVVRAAELAMTDRVGLSVDPDLIRQAFERSGEHDAEIYKRWSDMRPELEKAKLGKHKLAPAQYDSDGKRLRRGPYDWRSGPGPRPRRGRGRVKPAG